MKKIIGSILIVILFVCVFYSCAAVSAEEVEKFKIEEISTDEDLKVFESKKVHIKEDEKVFVWTELDLKYTGNLALRIQIQLYNDDDENIALLELDPLNPHTRVMCIDNNLGEEGVYKCTGLSKFYFPNVNVEEEFRHLTVDQSRDYYFKAIMYANSDADIKLNEAFIIIKK